MGKPCNKAEAPPLQISTTKPVLPKPQRMLDPPGAQTKQLQLQTLSHQSLLSRRRGRRSDRSQVERFEESRSLKGPGDLGVLSRVLPAGTQGLCGF